MKWQEVTLDFMNNGVVIGEEVLGYNPEWEDENFNPKGFRICFYCDFRGWVSARYNDSHDCYETEEDDIPMWIYPIDKLEPPASMFDDIGSII